jgi:hypothetical protein
MAATNPLNIPFGLAGDLPAILLFQQGQMIENRLKQQHPIHSVLPYLAS